MEEGYGILFGMKGNPSFFLCIALHIPVPSILLFFFTFWYFPVLLIRLSRRNVDDALHVLHFPFSFCCGEDSAADFPC